MNRGEEILSAHDVGMHFSGLTALDKVSFSVNAQEVLAVIGPNGAGKTTLFNIITGVYEASEGSVFILREDPARPFGFSAFFHIVASALFCGLALFCAVNIEELWAALISNNYIYRQPFPWHDLVPSLFTFWSNLSAWHSVGILTIGTVIGGCASWTFWDSARRSPEVVMRKGLARTFQNIRIFPKMTVIENVLVGMHAGLHASIIGDCFGLPGSRREQRRALSLAEDVLALVHLSDLRDLPAAKLSYGHQRRLEIARALASSPRLILLDEPAAGMNPAEAEELIEIIRGIRSQGIAVLLIEHHMNVVMGISDRIVVLDYGRKIAEGTPDEIRSNPAVIAAYLGREEHP